MRCEILFLFLLSPVFGVQNKKANIGGSSIDGSSIGGSSIGGSSIDDSSIWWFQY